MASHRSRSPSLLDSVSSRSASPAERQRWGRSSSSSSQRASPRQSSTMSPRRDRRSRSRSGGRNPRDDRERSFGHHRGRHVFRGYHSKGERHREPHAQPHPRAAGQLDEASHPDLASQRGRASLPPQASLFAANVQAMRRAVSDGFADTAGPPRRKFDRKGPRRDVYSNRGRPYRSPGHQRQEFGDSFSFPRDQQDRDAEALRPRPLRAVTPPLDAARERERVSSSAVRPRPPLSIRDDVTTIAPPDSTISPVAVSVELGEFNSSGSTAEASLSHMGSSVFVKNLPDECNWDFVSQFFRSFNPTEVCYAVDGWRVSFESAERRDNVVDAFHGTAVHGSVISVVPWVALSSRPPPETPDLNLHSSEIADDAVGVEVPQPSKTIILAQLPTESVAPSTVEEVAPQQPALIDECVNVVCEALLHTVAEHAWRDVVEAPVFAFLEEWAGRPHVPKPRETINASDSSQRAPSLPDQPPGPSAPAVSGQPAIMPEPALSRKSTQASESGRHATPDVHPAKLRRTRSSSAPRADAPTVVDRPSASQTSSLPCGFCGASDDQDQMAICSSREAGMPSPGCTSALHIYCMQPPVRRIPRQWACDACEKFRSGAGDALSSAQPPPRGDSGADDQSSGSDGEPPDEISMARSRSQRRPSAAGQGGVVSPKHWRAGARKGSSQRSRDNPLSSDNADDTANSLAFGEEERERPRPSSSPTISSSSGNGMAEQDQLPEPARSESLSLPPVHATGSVRTEGFYRLAKRQAAPKSPKQGFAADAKRDQNQEPDDTADVLSSRRSDRADRRRFCAALPAASTVLQGNALASRKKSLQLFRSSIHAWGVRTTEPLLAGELVIEYIGEIISARVADIREKQYERSGIGSSYFFKVDDDMIIDATKQGNLARYINHSCMPNCKARVVTVGTTRRIAIYALRAIRPGEELSYDYKFADEPEEDKIPCWCGTKRCRGFLN